MSSNNSNQQESRYCMYTHSYTVCPFMNPPHHPQSLNAYNSQACLYVHVFPLSGRDHLYRPWTTRHRRRRRRGESLRRRSFVVAKVEKKVTDPQGRKEGMHVHQSEEPASVKKLHHSFDSVSATSSCVSPSLTHTLSCLLGVSQAPAL